MQYQKLLFLILISFTFELRRHEFIRKLQVDSDLPNTEPETVEAETTVPFIVPAHQEDTTIPVDGPGPQPSGGATTPGGGIVSPDHNQTETEVPETTTGAIATNPYAFPGHENEVATTIPTVISSQTYSENTAAPVLILVGVGNFKQQTKAQTSFDLYYLKIDVDESGKKIVMPLIMRVTIKVTYLVPRGKGKIRGLEEEEEYELVEKEEEAVCRRISYDEDTNLRYDCSFNTDENYELSKVTMDPATPPSFEGMTGNAAPKVTVSSLANQTMTENGIQTATSNELLKTQYLLNDAVLEENGLRFKLTGEMNAYIPDKQIVLSFDEKGNGKLKNATCDLNYLQGRIYELDCLAEKGINAHLEGVAGITTGTQEKVIIHMKEGTDEVLNAGSNYMGLYNRGSSSGLSGGAIAGIVIACVIALLAIAIGAMLCRKTNVPAPFQESTLGVNTSNMTD